MTKQYKYLFGPVPSRRLGLSLGVDIVPLKTCTQNCIYCQLGQNCNQTLQRKAYVPAEEVLRELQEKIDEELKADYITFSGSGEPTLNSDIGSLIDRIREMTNIPIAVITNGTLLSNPAVRAECAKADVVLPSLDSGDEETFKKINLPHKDLDFINFISGLIHFRKEFTGQIWLEVFLIEGINTSIEQIEKIKALIRQILPDKVQLNTAVRPTTNPDVNKVDQEKLGAIVKQIGKNCEIIADFSKSSAPFDYKVNTEAILELLKRRPCSLDDICHGLQMDRRDIVKYIQHLVNTDCVISEIKDNKTFFSVKT